MIQFKNISQLREEIFRNGLDQFIVIKLGHKEVKMYPHAEKRMRELAEICDVPFTYAWYREVADDGTVTNHPTIDYQLGSMRDDFDFGSVIMLNAADVLNASEDFEKKYDDFPDGGWYALRLRMLTGRGALCINEYLYEQTKTDYRKSGEQQHDYVDPKNAEYQKAMEKVFTEHIKEINAFVDHRKPAEIGSAYFDLEASVVIPVRNRVSTIMDAVRSALNQLTDFPFNVIVVDNGSTDGTRQALLSVPDPRLHVILIDEEEGLGIGGCWNKAIESEMCGRFAVQLDSDDVYSGTDTLQRIVNKFYEENCAMVVGSYTLTDFDLNVIPPGLISHNEWTDENGANNALRINGFGAPRAFYTPIVRDILFPNVSYGEDYA
ncbi:MAG: glycosyltransferase, partial [Muribaculaceae bacterium]|nr:glycosyltransferase [Muribaculaceae bacterium]